MKNRLTDEDRERAKAAAAVIAAMFPWKLTPQGHDYWAEVHIALTRMGELPIRRAPSRG